MPLTEHTMKLAMIAAEAAADKLGVNPVLVDVSQRLAIAEAFLIISASSSRQVNAIGEEIMDQVGKKLRISPTLIEGRNEGTWMLVDYGDLVVHVFTQEEREFYALEKLWADGEMMELQPILDEAARAHSPVLSGADTNPKEDM